MHITSIYFTPILSRRVLLHPSMRSAIHRHPICHAYLSDSDDDDDTLRPIVNLNYNSQLEFINYLVRSVEGH